MGNVGIKHVWKFWPFFQKRLYALCLFARSLCFSNITTNVFYFHIFQQTHILYDTRSRTRPVISCPFRVKKKRIHFLKKKKRKEKRVQNHNIPRDISKFVGKKRKISQTYHYSLLFFIINPIYKKEIASNSRSNLFRAKKRETERERISSPKSLRITFNQGVFGIKSLSRRQVRKDSLLDVDGGKNSTASSINLSSGFYQEEDCCCTSSA